MCDAADHLLHLLHVQTNASSAAFYIGNADAGLLAYECEEAHNKERVILYQAPRVSPYAFPRVCLDTQCEAECVFPDSCKAQG